MATATTVPVGLCCNDARGHPAGLVLVDVGRVGPVTLEGDLGDGESVEFRRGSFTVGEAVFLCGGHRRHVGSPCWDQVTMSPAEAARLVNHLRALPHWRCHEAPAALFEKWESGAAFTADDFAGAGGEGS